MSEPKFDVEAFRQNATARSEPRDAAAATRASYSVEIVDVRFSQENATIFLRERGKVRGVDVFLDINHSGLTLLLGALNQFLFAKLKEHETRADEAEQRAKVLETALGNLAQETLELKAKADLPEDQLPELLVGQTWGWQLAEHARATAEEQLEEQAE